MCQKISFLYILTRSIEEPLQSIHMVWSRKEHKSFYEFTGISLEKAKENALPPCTGYLLQRYHWRMISPHSPLSTPRTWSGGMLICVQSVFTVKKSRPGFVYMFTKTWTAFLLFYKSSRSFMILLSAKHYFSAVIILFHPGASTDAYSFLPAYSW